MPRWRVPAKCLHTAALLRGKAMAYTAGRSGVFPLSSPMREAPSHDILAKRPILAQFQSVKQDLFPGPASTVIFCREVTEGKDFLVPVDKTSCTSHTHKLLESRAPATRIRKRLVAAGITTRTSLLGARSYRPRSPWSLIQPKLFCSGTTELQGHGNSPQRAIETASLWCPPRWTCKNLAGSRIM